MSSIQLWRQRLLEDLASDTRRRAAAARNQAAFTPGATAARSGALRGATEGIAGQEAVEASGINLMAKEMEEERGRADREAAQVRKDAEKAQRWGLVSGLVGDVAGAFLPGIAGRLFNRGAQAAAPSAPAAPAPASPVNAAMAQLATPASAGVAQDMNMLGTEQDPVTQTLLKRLKLKRRRQFDYPVEDGQPLNPAYW
jgi:hypothetical protein